MIEALYEYYLRHPAICTDTRKITAGCLFFALKGPNFDANKFVPRALESGAALCVTDDTTWKGAEGCFWVEGVLQALQELARYHRRQLTIPVIGLTGSNGKTTSKELTAVALGAKYHVYATPGNLNNHIGVAISVLGIRPEHEIAVIEMGANHVGEIAFLCTLCRPSHGYITNIGKAHLEGFGGIEGVIRGKSELYDFLIENEGTVWVNSGSAILSNLSKRFKRPLFYPGSGDFYHCRLVGADPEVCFEAENGEVVKTQLIGDYNFENIATALCVAKYFGVPAGDAHGAIAGYVPENNRSQVIRKGSNLIILDAYNANPTSMSKAIENLAGMVGENKVAILGDMNELGADAEKEHRAMAELLLSKGIRQVYLCGELMRYAHDRMPKADYFPKTTDLVAALKKATIKDAVILVKASRSLGLERVPEVL